MAILEGERWYLIVFKIQTPVTLSLKTDPETFRGTVESVTSQRLQAMLIEVAEGVALQTEVNC